MLSPQRPCSARLWLSRESKEPGAAGLGLLSEQIDPCQKEPSKTGIAAAFAKYLHI